MNIWQIILLAIVQGAAELLPVSSSAHVIVLEKILGLDPSTPELIFILVMLHTGTMLAVILYYWKRWAKIASSTAAVRNDFLKKVVIATALTGVVGLTLKHLIEKSFLKGQDVETLFSNTKLIAASLVAAGILIVYSSFKKTTVDRVPSNKATIWTGIFQGFCLPFRGLSRSGTTISVLMLNRMEPTSAEEFSFILAVVLTPFVIGRSVFRLIKAHELASTVDSRLILFSVVGFVASCIAGLIAMRLLSAWLQKGKWIYFGIYCFAFAAVILSLNLMSVI